MSNGVGRTFCPVSWNDSWSGLIPREPGPRVLRPPGDDERDYVHAGESRARTGAFGRGVGVRGLGAPARRPGRCSSCAAVRLGASPPPRVTRRDAARCATAMARPAPESLAGHAGTAHRCSPDVAPDGRRRPLRARPTSRALLIIKSHGVDDQPLCLTEYAQDAAVVLSLRLALDTSAAASRSRNQTYRPGG